MYHERNSESPKRTAAASSSRTARGMEGTGTETRTHCSFRALSRTACTESTSESVFFSRRRSGVDRTKNDRMLYRDTISGSQERCYNCCNTRTTTDRDTGVRSTFSSSHVTIISGQQQLVAPYGHKTCNFWGSINLRLSPRHLVQQYPRAKPQQPRDVSSAHARNIKSTKQGEIRTHCPGTSLIPYWFVTTGLQYLRYM